MVKSTLQIIALSGLVFMTACSGNEAEEEGKEEQTEPQKEEQKEKKDAILIQPLPGSPEFPDAKLSLVEPKDLNSLEAGETTFKFKVENYELSKPTEDESSRELATSAKGQHIHLILNNEPYMAKYQKEFEITLEEKPYQMIAFLSRSYHESVKSEGAYVEKQFALGSSKVNDSTQLYYSRPKGTYEGPGAERILLDFYLPKVKLSEEGHKVRVTIDGNETAILAEWKSYYIEGLQDGGHDITIELIDAEGNAVNPKMNTTTRTITVKK